MIMYLPYDIIMIFLKYSGNIFTKIAKTLDTSIMSHLYVLPWLQCAKGWNRVEQRTQLRRQTYFPSSLSTQREASLFLFLPLPIITNCISWRTGKEDMKMVFDLEDPLASFEEQENCSISELFACESDHLPTQNCIPFRCEAVSLISQVKTPVSSE